MRKHKVKAVHESDLQALLESLGLSGLMTAGELRCGVCSNVVTLENLLCIYPSQNEVKVCCNNDICYRTVLKEQQ